MPLDLFTCAASDITIEAVDHFVRTVLAERLQAESLVLEFKSDSNKENIPKAVAAMANTDGGIIVVGVDEDSTDNPLVGVPKGRHDAVVSSLRAKVPDAMPEVIPVAIPGDEERLMLLLRVDADSVIHPVVVDGAVYKRIPGQSIGARRDEIVALCSRSTSLSTMSLASSHVDLFGMQMWDDEQIADDESAEVRARARFVLPHRYANRSYLGSAAIAAAEEALIASPVPGMILNEQTGRHERGGNWWERTRTRSLVIDYASEPSTAGPIWRPDLVARARLYLNQRILEATIAVRITTKDRGQHRAAVEVRHIHDALLGTCWAAVTAGRASITELGADLALQTPALDAAVKGMFDRGPTSPGAHRPADSGEQPPRPHWPFPGRVPNDTTVNALDAMVKDWLHVPLYEIGMTDFEQDLVSLQPRPWARDLGVEAPTANGTLG